MDEEVVVVIGGGEEGQTLEAEEDECGYEKEVFQRARHYYINLNDGITTKVKQSRKKYKSSFFTFKVQSLLLNTYGGL